MVRAFHFANHGGACPLWSVHGVFRTPRQIVTQWLELPDGQRFFSIARTVTAGGGSFGAIRVERAIAVGCAAEHAGQLIYTRDALGPRADAPTPIGVACRVCHRPRCAARSALPIGRKLLPDDFRRLSVPFGSPPTEPLNGLSRDAPTSDFNGTDTVGGSKIPIALHGTRTWQDGRSSCCPHRKRSASTRERVTSWRSACGASGCGLVEPRGLSSALARSRAISRQVSSST